MRLRGVAVAGGAVGRLQARRVREVRRLREVRVAIDAGEARLSVDRRGDALRGHEDAPAVLTLRSGVAVAGEAVIVFRRLGGERRRRGEEKRASKEKGVTQRVTPWCLHLDPSPGSRIVRHALPRPS